MTESVRGHVVGHTTTQVVWRALARIFLSHSKAIIMQLRSQLQTTRKKALDMVDYLLQMKNIVDFFVAMGSPVIQEDCT